MSEPNPPITASTLQYSRLPEPEGDPPRPRYWLHVLLLLATCFTTLVMGARMQYNFDHGRPALSVSDEALPYFPATWMFSHPDRLLAGWPFATTVMLFFLAHEMGHYLCCRYYGVRATLPFFIPLPTPIGTMGAVILIRSRIRSRTELFDIGIAGPIAGFLVAIAVLVVALKWSKPVTNGLVPGEYDLGFPLIFGLLQHTLALVTPVLPMQKALLHPAAIAAWVGMFATSLNLLPGGQLDGGHITYAMSPQAHRYISWLTIGILLPMAYYLWMGWWIWAILLQLSTFRHPHVEDWPRISGKRAWLAMLAAAMLVLTLTPAPFQHASTPEFVQQVREMRNAR